MAHPAPAHNPVPAPSGEAGASQPITLFGQAERLKGRPKLCSDCGLCSSSYRHLMARTCVFVDNQTGEIEQRLHGRARRPGDELIFGIFQGMSVARLPRPAPGAQWSGIVTTLGARLLERDMVDAVITTGSAPGTRFAPLPILARTPAEVRASAGSKPCIAPNLTLLDAVRASGVRRLAVIGTGCQVHMLRAAEAELGLEQLYVIGIPCTDNTTYPDLLRFLRAVSRSPDTVVHIEFMQDYRLWMRHTDGYVEKINYVDIPFDHSDAIFPAACLACFDYPNTLADLTVGYIGAPAGWQWVIVRTAVGAEVFALVEPDLELRPLTAGGDRQPGMHDYVKMLQAPRRRPPALMRKLIAFLQRWRGPKGLEFARAACEIRLLRNLTFVRNNFPRHEARIVPYHVYPALDAYAATYAQVFGRALDREM